MKRILSTLFLIVSCLYANAYDFNDGTLGYTILSATDKTVEVSKCIDTKKTKMDASPLTIPETVDYDNTTYTVISIGEEGLANLRIKEITIPKTIKTIKFAAFYCTQEIKRVNITDLEAWCRIEYDNWYATFKDWRCWACPMQGLSDLYLNGEKVTDLVIPESITEIKPYTFLECKSLKSVTMSDNVTTIGRDAFSGCSNIRSFHLSKNLTYLGDEALEGCYNVDEITLPKTLEYFGYKAFVGDHFSKISVEDGCTNYDSRNDCNAVINSKTNVLVAGCKNTKIPEGVVAIDNFTFYGCVGLDSVVVPHSVEVIGESAFEDCPELKTISFTNNLKSMIFFGAGTELTDVNMDFVDMDDFLCYLNRDDIPDIFYQQVLDRAVHHIYINGKKITELTLPSSLTQIKDCALRNCADLKHVELGPDVTSIEQRSFEDCTGLESITISPSLQASNGHLTFDGCTSLKRVNISNLKAWCNIRFNVDVDDYDASTSPLHNDADLYLNGEKVTDLVIPDGITTVGKCQFVRCNSLNSVTFSSAVTCVEGGAFVRCANLSSITCRATTAPIADNDTFSAAHYTQATLYVPASALEQYKQTYPWSKFTNIKTISDTGIENVTADEDANAPCYDLTGRRIISTATGLVVQRGKKIILSK